MFQSIFTGIDSCGRTAILTAIMAMTGCSGEATDVEPSTSFAFDTSPSTQVSTSGKSNNPGRVATLAFNVERLIKLTTQWEYSNEQHPLYKYPDGATITYSINGTPTDSDTNTVKHVFEELSALTQLSFIQVTNTNESRMDIHFEPVDKFPSMLGNYVAGNYGFFTTPTIGTTIVGATILINTLSAEPARHHLIHEELTQSLGLFYDLPDDPTSIFYSVWNLVPGYNESDRKIIAALYTSGLTDGMTAGQIRQFFE